MENVQLVVADSGRQGRLAAFARSPRLILLDIRLPDCDAQDFMAFFSRAALRAPASVAVVSGDESERWRFIRAGGGLDYEAFANQ